MERRRLLNQCAAGAGTSPITRRSGKRKSVHARFVHNDRLLDALMLQAQSALRASPGVRAYYDKQVRHEALDVRGEVEDLRRLAVAAAGLKPGAARSGERR